MSNVLRETLNHFVLFAKVVSSLLWMKSIEVRLSVVSGK